MLLTPNPYSRPKTAIGKIKKVVIHWVGNPGSSAVANRNYFENLKANNTDRYASSHYIVGLEGEIIQCIPENEVAYHANDANSYSIGIENCHPDRLGQFNAKTYKSLITLCVDLCKRYHLDPLTDLIRHYDVTGKICPKYYVEHVAAWNTLKQDVKKALEGDTVITIKILLNGVEQEVAIINFEGHNYIKLRDLADSQINISYDNVKKMPIVQVKN